MNYLSNLARINKPPAGLAFGLIVVFLFAIGVVYSFDVFLIFVSLVCSYWLLKRGLFRLEGISKALLIVITPFFYAVFLQFLCLILWALHKNTPLSYALPITSISLILITVFMALAEKSKPSPTTSSLRRWSSADSTSILLAAFFLLFVLFPPLIRNHWHPYGTFISYISGNVDDAAHLGAINDRIEYNLGVFDGTKEDSNVRSMVMSGGSYPPGWHAANGAIIKAFVPHIKVGRESVAAYALSKIFWYATLLFVFFRFSVWALMRYKERLSIAAWVFGVLLLILFGFYYLIDPFRLGFYTFLPQIIAVPIFLWALYETSRTKTNPITMSAPLLVAAVVGIGGSMTWLLSLPVMLLILLLVLWGTITKYIQSLLKHPLFGIAILASALIIGLGIVSLLYLVHISESTGSIIDVLNLYGNIAIYNQAFLTFCLIGLLLFFSLTISRLQKHIIPLVIAASLLLAFTLIIYLIQIISVERINYYFYKTLDIFLVIAIPLAISGYTFAAQKLYATYASSVRPLSATVLSLMLFSITLLYIGFPPGNSPTISYLKGRLALQPSLVGYIGQYIKAASPTSPQGYTLVYLPQNPYNNDIANMLLKSIPRDSYCFKDIRPSFVDGTKPQDIVSGIKKVCSRYSIHIIATTKDDDMLFTEAINKYHLPNVSVEYKEFPNLNL